MAGADFQAKSGLLFAADAIVCLVLWVVAALPAERAQASNPVWATMTLDLLLLVLLRAALGVALVRHIGRVAEQRGQDPLRGGRQAGAGLPSWLVHALPLATGIYAAVKLRFLVGHSDSHPKENWEVELSFGAAAVGFAILELTLSSTGLYRFVMARQAAAIAAHGHTNGHINGHGHTAGKDVEAGAAAPKPAKKVNLGRLWALAKPERPLLAVGLVALAVSSVSQIFAPLYFGKVIDAVGPKHHSRRALNESIFALGIIYIIGAVAGFLRAWFFTWAGQRLVARVRKLLFGHIIAQEIAFFDTERTGELINRLSSDTQVIQNAMTVNISMLCRYLAQIVGSITLMFFLSWSLTLVLLSVVPPVAIGAVAYGKQLKKLRKKFQDALAAASSTAEESIGSIRTVRSFSNESVAAAAYKVDIDESYGIGKNLALLTGGFSGVTGTFASLAIILVLWYGGTLVLNGTLSTGLLSSFMLYTISVAMAFAFLSSLYGDFMQAVGASIRMFQILDRKPQINIEGGDEVKQLDAGLVVKELAFTYPTRPETQVLHAVSFAITPGTVTAIVGPSGGGKSTIFALLERFYTPDAGSITVFGRDISELDPVWYRRHVAMVSQEPTLFATSIKENIKYGKNTATDDEVMEAAKQANAHDFIMAFEDGYDTLVGERGVRLSGGQKQRIAISRALLVNPTILLLDEATSALDAESEHLVQEAIDRAMENRTVLVIAHRLSTVRNASEVMVIDKGAIIERGRHEELLALDGVYARLVERQLMEK